MSINLADLIPVFTKSDDRDKDAETLRVWVTAAARVAREDRGQQTIPEALTAQFEKLPSSELLKLTSALDQKSGDVYGAVEELREMLATGSPDVGEIARRFTTIQLKLDELSSRRRRRSLLLILARLATIAVPLVVGYFAATYFRFYNNVYFDSATVIVPTGTYEVRGSKFTIPAAFKDRYFKEFSRYYFGRPSSFVQQFRAADLVNKPFNLRAVFRNPRSADALLISSAETVVTIHDKPFEWSRVDVSTDLEVQPDSRGFTLSDRGIGPAVAIQYKVSAGELVVKDGSYQVLLNDTRTVLFDWTNSGIEILRTVTPNSDSLDTVFWLLDPQQSPTPGAELIACYDGRRFERVVTTSRLQQLTRIAKGGDGRLDVSFESLRGDPKSKSLTAPLPADLVYVESKSRLNREKDPCAFPITPAATAAATNAMTSAKTAALLDKLVGPPANLKGVDLIKAATALSLMNVPDEGAVSTMVSPEEILNSGGFLMFDVAVNNARNGTLDLTISVNGKFVSVVTSELLIPDAWSFSSDLVKERARFQKGSR